MNIDLPRLIPSITTTAVLTLCLICASAQCALAGEEKAGTPDEPRVTQLNEQGTTLYRQRHFRKAVEKFLEAYAIDHDPNLLFNIARCYERLGDSQGAIEKYQVFLDTPGADAEGRLKATRAIEQLETLEQAPPQETHAAQPAQAPAQAPAAAAATSPLEQPQTAPAPATEPEGSSVWPWVTVTAGTLVLGAGAAYYTLGYRDHKKVTKADGYGDSDTPFELTENETKKLVDSGDKKKLYGALGLGLGGALLTTAAALFLMPDTTEGQQVSIITLPGGGTLHFNGTF